MKNQGLYAGINSPELLEFMLQFREWLAEFTARGEVDYAEVYTSPWTGLTADVGGDDFSASGSFLDTMRVEGDEVEVSTVYVESTYTWANEAVVNAIGGGYHRIVADEVDFVGRDGDYQVVARVDDAGWFDFDDGDDLLYALGRGEIDADGGWGNDILITGSGDDELNGSWGDDLIDAGAGNDQVEGGWGDDHLFGGSGRDDIDGGWGDDILNGGSGDDRLDGGWGADTLNAGSGDNELRGGWGADVFEFDFSSNGENEIEDYSAAEDDIIVIRGMGFEFDGRTIDFDNGGEAHLLGGPDEVNIVWVAEGYDLVA